MEKKVKFFNDDSDCTRFDGWESLFSTFNKSKNVKNKGKLHYDDNDSWFTDELLDSMYIHDGLVHRSISCVAEDMTNKGFSITGDTANLNEKELNKLNLMGVLYDAMCKCQLHGGVGILLGVDDGGTLDSEIQLNRIKGIRFLRVIPKSCITPENEVCIDPNSEDYGKPEYYIIMDGISKEPYKVHKSRLHCFSWLEFSPVKSVVQRYSGLKSAKMWGSSVVERTFKQIGAVSLFEDSISHLSQEAVVGKYKLAGLQMLMAMGDEGYKKILRRLDIIDMAKSNINGVILDAENGEDYVRDSLQFRGIADVGNLLMILHSAVFGIPQTRLYGRSPSGFDSSGDSDLKVYYDMISSNQRTMLTEFVKKLVFYVDVYIKSIRIEDYDSMMKAVSNGKIKGGETPKMIRPRTAADVDIVWNPLYQMTEKEKAETYFTNAEADKMYMESGVLSMEEVRKRFIGGYDQTLTVESADLPNGVELLPEKQAEWKAMEFKLTGKDPEYKPQEPNLKTAKESIPTR